MADWTDAELRRLEKSINAEYTKAYQQCKAEMSEIMARIQAHPEWTAEKRLLEMNKYNRLNSLCEQMAATLKDTNATAQRFIGKSSANVYTHNYNADAERLGFSLIDNTAAKNILTENVNPFTQIAFDKMKNKALLVDRLKSEMISSLLIGESIPKMAHRIKNVTESSLSDAIRIARTETTRVENSARAAIGDEGERLGFDMWKRWVATNDNRTRDAHADMDGAEIPKDEAFVVDGEELMYPGDISLGASGKNVCNCRCTVVYFIKEKPKEINATPESASEDWFEYEKANAMSEYIRTGKMPTHDLYGEVIPKSERAILQKEADIIQDIGENTRTKYRTVYRGMVMDEDELSHIAVNDKYSFDSIRATTTDPKVARIYTDVENSGIEDGVSVIFEIQKSDGLYGFDRDGVEIVLPKGSQFRVARKYKDEDGVVHISLYSGKGKNVR